MSNNTNVLKTRRRFGKKIMIAADRVVLRIPNLCSD